jgi:hypothetical protein
VNKEDGEQAARIFCIRCLLNGQREAIDAQHRIILDEGLTPIIVVLAAKETNLACGLVSMCCLPKSFGEQVDREEEVR